MIITKKHLSNSNNFLHFLSHVVPTLFHVVLYHSILQYTTVYYLLSHVVLPCYTVASCPQLDNPTNGRVFVTGLGVQEQAIYICDEGFVIDGLLVRICLDDGEWGGDNPTCASEQRNMHYCLLLYCLKLCVGRNKLDVNFGERERSTAGIG